MRVAERDSLIPPLWILTLITVSAGFWVAFQLKELIVLLVVGYFIAYAVDPAVERMEKFGFSRSVSVLLTFGLLLAVIILLAVSAVPTVVAEFGKLSSNFGEYARIGKEKLGPVLQQVQELIPPSIRQGRDVESIMAALPELSGYLTGDVIHKVVSTVVGTLLKGYSITLTIVNILLLPFIVFYIAADLHGIHSFFLSLAPITKRNKLANIFSEIDGYVSSFVRGQIIVCSILFVLYAIGLGLLRVDLWLLLAAISGFGNIVPYFGLAIGIVLSTFLTLVTFGDLTHLIYVWVVYGIVQFLEGMFITPRIMGESVGLSPLVIILALFAGGQLFGLLGIFLAVPAAAALRVLGRHAYSWALKKH